MISGLSGSLLSQDAMRQDLDATRINAVPHQRWFQAWQEQLIRDLGPASSARTVYDRVVAPLIHALGLHIASPAGLAGASDCLHGLLQMDGAPVAAFVVNQSEIRIQQALEQHAVVEVDVILYARAFVAVQNLMGNPT